MGNKCHNFMRLRGGCGLGTLENFHEELGVEWQAESQTEKGRYSWKEKF